MLHSCSYCYITRLCKLIKLELVFLECKQHHVLNLFQWHLNNNKAIRGRSTVNAIAGFAREIESHSSSHYITLTLLRPL